MVWPKNNGINDIRFVLNQPGLTTEMQTAKTGEQ